MQDYTSALIDEYTEQPSSPIDPAAVQKFEDALKQGDLDLPAWRQAYWGRVKEAGLEGIFTKSGLLKNDAWEAIKDCKDPELFKGLRKLFVAYRYDRARTPEGKIKQAQNDAIKAAQPPRDQRLLAEVEWSANNMRDFCRRANANLKAKFRRYYPKLTAEFEELTGKKIEDCIAIWGQIPILKKGWPIRCYAGETNKIVPAVCDFTDIIHYGHRDHLEATKLTGPEDPKILQMVKEMVWGFVESIIDGYNISPNGPDPIGLDLDWLKRHPSDETWVKE